MKEFHDIGSFVEHLGMLIIEEKLAEHHALEKCAQIVEKCAKEKIGEYQQQEGPFIAWAELADSTKADREHKGYSEDDPLLRTGDMRNSIEHTHSPDGLEVQIGSNSDIALWQEAGTQHIPPRSFLGGAMAEKLPELKEVLASTVYMALTGHKVSAALLGGGIVKGGIDIK